MSAATCSTCRHWSPFTTPKWAWRDMRMAVCMLLNTRAITMGAGSTCAHHARASDDVVADRARSLGLVGS